MLLIADNNRDNVIKHVKEGELVVGIEHDFIGLIQVEDIDKMVGHLFMVDTPLNQEYYKSRKALYRIDGYTVCETYRIENVAGNNLFEDTLNKDGRFYDSHRLMGFEQNGNHKYAYESEKVFKTLAEAMKKAIPGKHWIRVTAVHTFTDETGTSTNTTTHKMRKV